MTDRIEATLKEVRTLLKHLKPLGGTFEKAWIEEVIQNIELCIPVNIARREEADLHSREQEDRWERGVPGHPDNDMGM